MAPPRNYAIIGNDNSCPHCHCHCAIQYSEGGIHAGHHFLRCLRCRWFYAFTRRDSELAIAQGWVPPKRKPPAAPKVPRERQKHEKCVKCGRGVRNRHCKVLQCSDCCRASTRRCHLPSHRLSNESASSPSSSLPAPTSDFTFRFEPPPTLRHQPSPPHARYLRDVDNMLDRMDAEEEPHEARRRQEEAELLELDIRLSREIAASTSASSSFPSAASSSSRASAPANSSSLPSPSACINPNARRTISQNAPSSLCRHRDRPIAQSSLSVTSPPVQRSLAQPSQPHPAVQSRSMTIIELDSDGEDVANKPIELDSDGEEIIPKPRRRRQARRPLLPPLSTTFSAPGRSSSFPSASTPDLSPSFSSSSPPTSSSSFPTSSSFSEPPPWQF
ncbi:hypothetical protein C8J56DRAFT_1040085 [Mycena floridula]|nr:hypothetical protein C8J56DRAFT_1040085 [Mycena floridula]